MNKKPGQCSPSKINSFIANRIHSFESFSQSSSSPMYGLHCSKARCYKPHQGSFKNHCRRRRDASNRSTTPALELAPDDRLLLRSGEPISRCDMKFWHPPHPRYLQLNLVGHRSVVVPGLQLAQASEPCGNFPWHKLASKLSGLDNKTCCSFTATYLRVARKIVGILTTIRFLGVELFHSGTAFEKQL